MENEQVSVQDEVRPYGRWPWFVGGCALSITSLCSVVLLVLFLVSLSMNAYLAWNMSGYQVHLSRAVPVSTIMVVVTPGEELALIPPPATLSAPSAEVSVPTGTPAPVGTPEKNMPAVNAPATLEIEYATLAAIGTQVAEIDVSPSAEPERASSEAAAQTTGTPQATAAAAPQDEVEASPTRALQAASSTNVYTLIPIDGNRESRPADEHGDLNLKLREPEPSDLPAALNDIPGSGIDPNAPSLSAVFEPNFTRTFAVHDWDWGCNCKGNLIDDGKAILVGIETTPGEPVFIPKTDRDIYEGKYYAVVLYAARDTLTMQYARRGNVAEGFTVHYLGLQTDPNLVKTFQESKGSSLPGLTLDVPVGVAGDELVVAIRDNGTFLDARSKQDWWN